MEKDKFWAAQPIAQSIDRVSKLQEEIAGVGKDVPADNVTYQGVNTERSVWGYLLTRSQHLHSVGVNVDDIEGVVKAEVFSRLAAKKAELDEKFNSI